MVGVQRSWQAELGLAGEQLSRQVVMKSVMDPTPNVLLNLLKVIYIRQRGYVKRKTRDDCEGVRGRSRAGGRGWSCCSGGARSGSLAFPGAARSVL